MVVITKRQAKRIKTLKEDLKLLGIDLDVLIDKLDNSIEIENKVYSMLTEAINSVKKDTKESMARNKEIMEALSSQETLR